MGSWISKDGVMKPAIERTVLYDRNGDPNIYEGPCRSAMEYLNETGQEFLGMLFNEDPEVIERAHGQNKTVEKFCKTDIYTQELRDKQYAEKAKLKVNHSLPTRKPATKQTNTGGVNRAGGGSIYGGFGDDGDVRSEAIATVPESKKSK